jgi:hypothetical protein
MFSLTVAYAREATPSSPRPHALAELHIDCEEDRRLRAVLVGLLRDADREPKEVVGGSLC